LKTIGSAVAECLSETQCCAVMILARNLSGYIGTSFLGYISTFQA